MAAAAGSLPVLQLLVMAAALVVLAPRHIMGESRYAKSAAALRWRACWVQGQGKDTRRAQCAARVLRLDAGGQCVDGCALTGPC